MGGKSDQHAKAWTPERRRKQRERIMSIEPWLHSTGPTSSEGKMRSSQNATNRFNYATDLQMTRFMKRQNVFMQLFKNMRTEQDRQNVKKESELLKQLTRNFGE